MSTPFVTAERERLEILHGHNQKRKKKNPLGIYYFGVTCFDALRWVLSIILLAGAAAIVAKTGLVPAIRPYAVDYLICES